MRKIHLAVLVLAVSAVLLHSASGEEIFSSAAVGTRYHTSHSAFTAEEGWPYNEGDLSLSGAYEWHEEAGYWQLAVEYVSLNKGSNTADYAVTPQLNLVFNDGIWRGGIGVLDTYLQQQNGEGDWSGIYWQMLAGLSFPLYKTFTVDIFSAYPFKEWARLKEFKWADLEFGGWVNFTF
ncbi:MAG: hypothetical protein HQ559_06410 [Lentisphaerae bacterium]|nr:hypothetical protein [Lentisphaerota bacterium]